jgi:chromosome segregation ATPase
MTKDDKALLEFLLNRMKDDAYSAAKKIENLSQQIASTVEQIGIYEDGIAEVNAKLEAGDISPKQAIDQLRELRGKIIEATESLWEMRKAIVEGVSSAIKAFEEDMDRGVTKIEHYSSVLNNYKNIIDIVGKDMLGLSDENINALNSAIVTNANANIRAIKAEWDAAQSTLNNLRQKRQEAEERGDN